MKKIQKTKIIKFIKQIVVNVLRRGVKIGVSYNLFDGEELLEASIKSIRKNVHYVNVVYQVVSNFGNPANPELKEKLEKLKEEGLIDEIYLYEPNLKLEPHQNEMKKRDIGLQLAKKNGCNYFLSMDTDEFYDEEEFKNSVDRIIASNITTSAVSIIDYIKSPENQIVGNFTFTPSEIEPYNYYVPFLIKIKKIGRQNHGKGYFPCLVDTTRKLSHPGRFKLFSVQEIAMHHMTAVRKDLNKKYENSSALGQSKERQEHIKTIQDEVLAFDFENNKKLPEDCSIFRKNIVRKVPNKFNIDLD